MAITTRKSKTSGLMSVLVAVAGERPDVDVVRLACELLVPQKGVLYVVYVIEVERSLPVDAEITPATAKGEEILRHMEEVTKPYKCEIHAELLQSRQAGLAVLQEAMDKRVDAIVLGVSHNEEYGSFTLGETAPYILKNAPCRVLLWRDLMPGLTYHDDNQA